MPLEETAFYGIEGYSASCGMRRGPYDDLLADPTMVKTLKCRGTCPTLLR
jgi:hypothetical protein